MDPEEPCSPKPTCRVKLGEMREPKFLIPTGKVIPGPEEEKKEETVRLNYLVRMKNAVNERLDNRAAAHPYGMTSYDYKSINECRRPCLEEYKMKIRRENYKYIKKHPEIDAMIEILLGKLVKRKPEEPVRAVAEFFTLRGTNEDKFNKQLEEEMKKIKTYREVKELFEDDESKRLDHDFNVNMLKKVNMGPLAYDFALNESGMNERKCRPKYRSYSHPRHFNC